jgi:hypothetical protein
MTKEQQIKYNELQQTAQDLREEIMSIHKEMRRLPVSYHSAMAQIIHEAIEEHNTEARKLFPGDVSILVLFILRGW